jgi:hypothetical protein
MIKMCAKAILITIIAGVVIAVIGMMKKWDTSLAYGNAFFIAGSLVIIAGGMSRLATDQGWTIFQYFSAESFANMNSGERVNYIIDSSSL